MDGVIVSLSVVITSVMAIILIGPRSTSEFNQDRPGLIQQWSIQYITDQPPPTPDVPNNRPKKLEKKSTKQIGEINKKRFDEEVEKEREEIGAINLWFEPHVNK